MQINNLQLEEKKILVKDFKEFLQVCIDEKLLLNDANIIKLYEVLLKLNN